MDETRKDEVGGVNGSEQSTTPEPLIINKETILRLRRWRDERPVTKLAEWNARRVIAKAAIKDIETPLARTREGISPEDLVILTTREAMEKVRNLTAEVPEPTNGNPITRFRKEEDGALVAEEVRLQGGVLDVLSQARIYPTGKTELTLNFTGTRYEADEKENSRNPGIVVNDRFPRATIEVFKNLTRDLK